MTAREPSAVEVITDALVMSPLSDMGGTVMAPFNRAAAEVLAALKAAGFVVATRDEIRAMTPEQQAEVIGGEVIDLDGCVERVVGPWRDREEGER